MIRRCLIWHSSINIFFSQNKLKSPLDKNRKGLFFVLYIQKKDSNIEMLLSFGRQIGLEPTTHGTTIRYSNQLSYNRHLGVKKDNAKIHFFLFITTPLTIFFKILFNKQLQELSGNFTPANTPYKNVYLSKNLLIIIKISLIILVHSYDAHMLPTFSY